MRISLKVAAIQSASCEQPDKIRQQRSLQLIRCSIFSPKHITGNAVTIKLRDSKDKSNSRI